MRQTILSAENVCKTFSEKEKDHLILNHINVDVYAKDFTMIMGPSGAGKSTLLYALSGMDSITDGNVWFIDGAKRWSICKESERQMAQLRAERFGFVFQQTHLVSNLSVEENILVAGYNSKKMSTAELKRRADVLFSQLHIEGIKKKLPGETSGGEAQRAAIARAMINEPEIIFADEPTGALNRANTESILDIFTEINRQGQSILMVTHDIRAAIRGTRILYLEDGRIVGELRLEPYEKQKERERNDQVSDWLRELSW